MEAFLIGFVQAGTPVIMFWLMLLSEEVLPSLGERILAVMMFAMMVWMFCTLANDAHFVC